MRKTIYVLINVSLSLITMGYGMRLESESLLVNGMAVLELVVPALTFLLTQIFILMFEKENNPYIILGTGLAIGSIANVIAIGYYSLPLEDIDGGLTTLILILASVCALSWISLSLYAKIKNRVPHPQKLHRQ